MAQVAPTLEDVDRENDAYAVRRMGTTFTDALEAMPVRLTPV
jgi:hypothetical protein